MEEYLRLLEREFLLRKDEVEGLNFVTFYAGGGTPTLLPPSFYERLLSFLARHLSLSLEEATIEVNPEGLNLKLLQGYRRVFNRLSLGAQSLSPRGLRVLGRLHEVEDIKKAVFWARKAGFENLSLDLIFAWPGQRVSEFEEELEHALSLAPEHLSCYELTLEPGTRLFEEVRAARLRKPPEEEILEMFALLWEKLEEAGFEHYEISNYARPGKRCQHNLFYWQARPYLGLGPGAASFLGARRSKTREDLSSYQQALSRGMLPPREEEILSREKRFREAVILGLRLCEGVNREELKERFGFDLFEYYAPQLEVLELRGLLFRDDKRVRLTKKGLLLANVVFRELV